jgi:hypothetical protein
MIAAYSLETLCPPPLCPLSPVFVAFSEEEVQRTGALQTQPDLLQDILRRSVDRPHKETAMPGDPLPADLDLNVTTEARDGRTRLRFTLHSSRGIAGLNFHAIEGPQLLGDPAAYSAGILRKIEKLGMGLDFDGSLLPPEEVNRKLVNLGQDLYRELFPPELQRCYRRFRDEVQTLNIISDEPWIPWELIKPWDDSEPEIVDDPFLCEKFKLTRWLAGSPSPAQEILPRSIACVVTAPDLPKAAKEREIFSRLAAEFPDLTDASPATVNLATIRMLVQEGTGVLHFTGHGKFDAAQPNESGIPLPDEYVLRPADFDGSLQARMKRDRPLVFLNACQASRQGWAFTGLGGWVERFVNASGCGAFVGPLWSVRDSLALGFAETFYNELAQGKTLGEAAWTARQHVREQESGAPSWLAYTIYGHPNAKIRLGPERPEVEPPDPDIALAPAGIREKVLSFALLIRRKTAGFVGRQWLFDAIDGFIQKETRGYVQILGDPGIGKTTLIAEMVKRHRYPHHFNIRSEGIRKPDQFLPSLCAQLVAKFGLGYSTLPPEVSRDASFLINLLDKVAAKLKSSDRKLLILVDALDESDPSAVTRGSNTLYLPAELPDGVFIVVTSRRGSEHLRYSCADHKIDLQKEAENNFADVRLFAQSWLGREGIQTYIRNQGLNAATFVDEIVRLSEGNFMYLHYLLPEIEKGTYRDMKFDSLPVGLRNYYEDAWVRMREGDPDAWFDYKLPVLVALTIAKEPISLELIAEFSHIKLPRILQVLAEWAPLLQPIEVEEEGHREIRWRLYHDSFHDFVAAKDQVRGERVDLKAAHGKVADALWKALYPE